MRAVGDLGASDVPATPNRPAKFRPIPGLTPAQNERLARVLSEPITYVDHASFRRAAAERELFGEHDVVVSSAVPWCNALDADEAPPRRTVVLTTDEERRLFRQLNFARYRIARTRRAIRGRLTKKVALELLNWAERADRARDAIVQINMPLVLAMAKRSRLGGVDYAELISEGNMALMRAVEKFDFSRGFKFSTYSCRAILKSFSRVALRSSRYRSHFPTEFDPTLERSDFLDQCRVSAEADCVDDLRTIMARNLAALNEIERTVIVQRFALDADKQAGLPPLPKTLEEVGTIIGVTKERVRQIQNRALSKLRTALQENFLAA